MRPRSTLPALGTALRLGLVAVLASTLALGAVSPAVAESAPPTAPAIEETSPPTPGGEASEPEAEPAPAVDEPSEQVASATLTGVVTSTDGVPVGDVGVNAYRHNGEYLDYVAGTPTAEDGGYAFDSLEPGTYTLEFTPPYGSAFVGEWWNDQREQWSADMFELIEGDALSGMDAVLALGGAVEGVVSDADGTPLPDAGVTAYAVVDGSLEHRGTAWTGPDGTFRIGGLSEGTYTLEFGAPWSTAYAGEWWNDKPDQNSADTFEVVGGQTVSGLVAGLSAGGSITGVVTGVDDAPLAGVSVVADGPNWSAAVTDADGVYAIQGLAAGSYTVSFEPDAFDPGTVSGYVAEYWDDAATVLDAAPVNIGGGETVAGIDARLARAGGVSGVVTFDGEPIAGVEVSVSGAGWGSATTDADGRYEVLGLSAGVYDVWFSMPSGSPYRGGGAAVEVPDGETAVLDYTPERAAGVNGRITVAGSGTAVAGATVTLYTFGGASAGIAVTDDDGRYVVAPLDGGRYLLEVTGPGISTTWSGGSPTRAGADSFSVAPSTDVRHDVEAPAAGSGAIAGTVSVETGDGVVAAQGAVVELHTQRGLVRTVSADADGGYRFDGLDAGSYAVRFAETPWSSQTWWWDGSLRDTARFFEVGTETVTRDLTLPGLGWISSAIDVDPSYTGDILMEAVDPDTGEVLASGSTIDGDVHTLYEVPAGGVKLRFSGPIHDSWWGGGSFAEAPTIAVPIGGEARADASLSLDTVLSGTVLDSEGAPVPGVGLLIAAVDDARTFWAYSDDSGGYRVTGLEPGEYRVGVSDGAVGASSPVIVEIAAGAAEATRDIRLEAATRLVGTVTHRGEPVESCVGVREVGAPSRESFCTDSSGAYELRLRPGTYQVSFRTVNDVGAAGQVQQVTVAPGHSGTLELDADLETGGVIEGRVTADLGDGPEPIAGHWVHADGVAGPAASAETSADGSYRLWGLQNDVPYDVVFGYPWNDLGMEWWNDAPSPGSATTVTPGAEPVTGIDAELRRGAGLSGRVTDADGLGASHVTVEVYSADGDLLGDQQADSQGSYWFNGLPSGDVKLRFVPSADWTPGYLAEWWQDAGAAASAEPVAVEAGRETAGVDATLNRVGTVPVELSEPAVSGVARVGSTLTAVAAATTDGATLGYEWLADDAVVAGAAGAELVLEPEHLGKRISVRVTGTAEGHLPTTLTSSQTDPVEAEGVDPTLPRISGSPVVRERLRVDAGPKPPGARFAYRWFADGAPIAGPPTSTLRLTEAHVGARITVLVTTLRGRVVVEQRMSEPTLPVQPAGAVHPRGPGAQG
ncbi:carboxypeptidase regulatory-like domain-containing protein [Agromyces sp. NPDC058126]|uniref:carboxypeptidase regulatory-like domain-containing protein n=1 Tax=Agromyces sp. NPDC058126 TaxID=3346350 RepID=UPI0036D85009